MTEDKNVRKLREKLETALSKRKDDEAIKLLGKLIEAEPKAPRWPHKRGELYRKRNRNVEAVESYTIAANLYADQGFLARAVAMAKTIIDIDATRIDVLERIDPEAARKLHREQRQAISLRPATHPAVAVSDPAPRHPALLPEEPVAVRHPAIVPEDDAPIPVRPPPTRERGLTRVKAAIKRQSSGADVERSASPAPPARRSREQDISVEVLELADELTIAPDVKPNETRFSNAPPAGGLRPSLTEPELEPRTPAGRDRVRPLHRDAITLSKLPLFPLFAELPHQALIELVKHAEMIELEDGATVVRKGERADALYGIVEGSVDVMVPGQQLRMTLAEGDVFGEACLLAGEKRHADVVVRGHLAALKIPRNVLNSLLAAFPQMAEIVLELLTRRLLGNLLQSSPLFQEFDGHGRQELAQLFEIRRVPMGMVLAERGKLMDGLYVNLTGAFEVSYGDERPAETHETGTMFGQASLLTQDPSDVSVRALANMLVLRLPSAAFHTIAMQYPGMLAHLSELASYSVAKITT